MKRLFFQWINVSESFCVYICLFVFVYSHYIYSVYCSWSGPKKNIIIQYLNLKYILCCSFVWHLLLSMFRFSVCFVMNFRGAHCTPCLIYMVESASLFSFGMNSERFTFFRAVAQFIFFCSHSFVFVNYKSWIISTPTQENYTHYLCITSRYHVRAYNI